MHGGENERRHASLDQPPALDGHAKIAAQQCLRRGSAEANDHSGMQEPNLGLQPIEAGRHFALRWRFVHATLPSREPAEMFDGVRDVDLLAVDPCLGECGIEQSASWSYEGTPGLVLPVAGLLAYHH